MRFGEEGFVKTGRDVGLESELPGVVGPVLNLTREALNSFLHFTLSHNNKKKKKDCLSF